MYAAAQVIGVLGQNAGSLAASLTQQMGHAMSADGQLTALLHVSAVVTVLTLAFLGLDRSHIEVPNYKDGLVKVKPLAEKILLRLGFRGAVPESILGYGFFRRIRTTFPAAIICLIADDMLPLSAPLAMAHVPYRQKRVPLFGYFKKWNHQRVVGWAAIFSTFTFLSAAAAIFWDEGWIVTSLDGWLLRFPFIVLTLILGWLMWTGAAMRALSEKRLENTCVELEAKITARLIAAQVRQAARLAATRSSLNQRVRFHSEQAKRAEAALAKLPKDSANVAEDVAIGGTPTNSAGAPVGVHPGPEASNPDSDGGKRE